MMRFIKSPAYSKIRFSSIQNSGTMKGLSRWWQEFRKGKMGVVGLVIFTIMLLLVLFAPVIATHDPMAMSEDKSGVFLAPSWRHLLGTTNVGQDVYSQLLFAGRTSIMVGVVTALIIIFTATIIGLIAGFYGGIIDELLMRLADILMVIPRLPLLIVLASLMGPGLFNLILLLAVLGWTRPARQIRALTLSLRQYPYVESARAKGASSLYIIVQHIFPNVSGVVLAHFIMEVVAVILLETGMTFLGFGDPSRPSWGYMLYSAQSYGAFTLGAWWWWFPPGLCISLLCLGMAFIGTNLNDRFILRLGRGGRR